MRSVTNDEKNLEKIAVLYGYVPGRDTRRRVSDEHGRVGRDGESESEDDDGEEEREKREKREKRETKRGGRGVRGGEHAARLVMDAIRTVALGDMSADDDEEDENGDDHVVPKGLRTPQCVNRSYSSNSRGGRNEKGGMMLRQDSRTGAVAEVLCARSPPLGSSSSSVSVSASASSPSEKDEDDGGVLVEGEEKKTEKERVA